MLQTTIWWSLCSIHNPAMTSFCTGGKNMEVWYILFFLKIVTACPKVAIWRTPWEYKNWLEARLWIFFFFPFQELVLILILNWESIDIFVGLLLRGEVHRNSTFHILFSKFTIEILYFIPILCKYWLLFLWGNIRSSFSRRIFEDLDIIFKIVMGNFKYIKKKKA